MISALRKFLVAAPDERGRSSPPAIEKLTLAGVASIEKCYRTPAEMGRHSVRCQCAMYGLMAISPYIHDTQTSLPADLPPDRLVVSI